MDYLYWKLKRKKTNGHAYKYFLIQGGPKFPRAHHQFLSDLTSLDRLAKLVWGGVWRPSLPQLFIQTEVSKFHILLNCYCFDHKFWRNELVKHMILPATFANSIFTCLQWRCYCFSFRTWSSIPIPFLVSLLSKRVPSSMYWQSRNDVGFGLQQALTTIWCNQRVAVSHFEADHPFRSFPSSIVNRVPSSLYWQSRKG